MIRSLLIVPFLAASALAQEDLWKTLSKGDRIQVTFRSGNSIQGNLTSKPADPRVAPGAVDYSTASEITLDVSLEYPGLNGTMTIPKKEIREVHKLQNLDPGTLKRIQEEMKRIRAQSAADEAQRQAEEADRDKTARLKIEAELKAQAAADKDKNKGAQLLKDFQDLQKGKDLLKQFPPDKYGPQTLKDAVDMAIRKQPVPPDYQQFADPETQRLWNLALRQQQADSAANTLAPQTNPGTNPTTSGTSPTPPGPTNNQQQ